MLYGFANDSDTRLKKIGLGFSISKPMLIVVLLFLFCSCRTSKGKKWASDIQTTVFQYLADSSIKYSTRFVVSNRSRMKEKRRLYFKDFKSGDSLFPRSIRRKLLLNNLVRGSVRINLENDSIVKHPKFWCFENDRFKRRVNRPELDLKHPNTGYFFSNPAVNRHRTKAWLGIYSFNHDRFNASYYYFIVALEMKNGYWVVVKVQYYTRILFCR
jgi:hypothetical protein